MGVNKVWMVDDAVGVLTSLTDGLDSRVQEDTGGAVGVQVYDSELLQRILVLIHQHTGQMGQTVTINILFPCTLLPITNALGLAMHMDMHVNIGTPQKP